MSQYLPTEGFKWISEKNIDKLNLAKYPDDSKKGLVLETDLEYPKELHNLHDDYPLAAEMLMTNNVEKLVPNLNDKEREVLHHKVLKLYG